MTTESITLIMDGQGRGAEGGLGGGGEEMNSSSARHRQKHSVKEVWTPPVPSNLCTSLIITCCFISCAEQIKPVPKTVSETEATVET